MAEEERLPRGRFIDLAVADGNGAEVIFGDVDGEEDMRSSLSSDDGEAFRFRDVEDTRNEVC